MSEDHFIISSLNSVVLNGTFQDQINQYRSGHLNLDFNGYKHPKVEIQELSNGSNPNDQSISSVMWSEQKKNNGLIHRPEQWRTNLPKSLDQYRFWKDMYFRDKAPIPDVDVFLTMLEESTDKTFDLISTGSLNVYRPYRTSPAPSGVQFATAGRLNEDIRPRKIEIRGSDLIVYDSDKTEFIYHTGVSNDEIVTICRSIFAAGELSVKAIIGDGHREIMTAGGIDGLVLECMVDAITQIGSFFSGTNLETGEKMETYLSYTNPLTERTRLINEDPNFRELLKNSGDVWVEPSIITNPSTEIHFNRDHDTITVSRLSILLDTMTIITDPYGNEFYSDVLLSHFGKNYSPFINEFLTDMNSYALTYPSIEKLIRYSQLSSLLLACIKNNPHVKHEDFDHRDTEPKLRVEKKGKSGQWNGHPSLIEDQFALLSLWEERILESQEDPYFIESAQSVAYHIAEVLEHMNLLSLSAHFYAISAHVNYPFNDYFSLRPKSLLRLGKIISKNIPLHPLSMSLLTNIIDSMDDQSSSNTSVSNILYSEAAEISLRTARFDILSSIYNIYSESFHGLPEVNQDILLECISLVEGFPQEDWDNMIYCDEGCTSIGKKLIELLLDQTQLPINNALFALGYVHQSIGDRLVIERNYQEALCHFHLALDCYLSHGPTSSLSYLYSRISMVYNMIYSKFSIKHANFILERGINNSSSIIVYYSLLQFEKLKVYLPREAHEGLSLCAEVFENHYREKQDSKIVQWKDKKNFELSMMNVSEKEMKQINPLMFQYEKYFLNKRPDETSAKIKPSESPTTRRKKFRKRRHSISKRDKKCSIQ